MQRLNGHEYKVVENERIELEITTLAISPMIVAALDGHALEPIDPRKISFLVTKSLAETHFLDLRFLFPPEPPAGSQYEVRVTGSVGHESDSFTVRPEDPHHDVNLRFFVGDTGMK